MGWLTPDVGDTDAKENDAGNCFDVAAGTGNAISGMW